VKNKKSVLICAGKENQTNVRLKRVKRFRDTEICCATGGGRGRGNKKEEGKGKVRRQAVDDGRLSLLYNTGDTEMAGKKTNKRPSQDRDTARGTTRTKGTKAQKRRTTMATLEEEK
jgi:hypothetical protein